MKKQPPSPISHELKGEISSAFIRISADAVAVQLVVLGVAYKWSWMPLVHIPNTF
jgi:hypothetical protein